MHALGLCAADRYHLSSIPQQSLVEPRESRVVKCAIILNSSRAEIFVGFVYKFRTKVGRDGEQETDNKQENRDGQDGV